MKTKLLLLSTFLAAFLISSCEAEYNELDNGVFLGEAQNSSSKNVVVEEEGAMTSVFVNLAAPVQKDVKAYIDIDSTALKVYNKQQGVNYKPLPANYFSVEGKECIIKAGNLSSSMVNILIKPFDDNLEFSEKYAIPLSVKSADGVDILKSSSSIVILCDRIINQKVYFTNGGYNMSYAVEEGDELNKNLEKFTIEFLVYSSSFSLNKHLLEFKNRYDNKSNLFARFGEYDHPVDEIQFKINQVPFYGPSKYAKNKWYHVAVVNEGSTVKLYQNGLLDVVIDHPVPGAKYNWTDFSIKHQNPGALSEFRIWNVARSQADIQNNMYAVNPKSEGLISYWKFDDDEGDYFTDYTGNGRKLLRPRGTWKIQKFPPEN